MNILSIYVHYRAPCPSQGSMKLTSLLLLLHLACIVLTVLLPYAIEGTEAFAEIASYAAVLYPLAMFLEKKLYPLASLLTVSTICHILASLCYALPRHLPKRWHRLENTKGDALSL